MKYILIIIVVFGTLQSCGGDTESTEQKKETQNELDSAYYLKGKIDGQYEIMMQLYMPRDNGAVSGQYFYVSQGKPIDLDGDYQDGDLKLDEWVGDEVTGQFDGDFKDADGNVSYVGIWKTTEKNFEFELERSSYELYYSHITEEDTSVDNGMSWNELLDVFEAVTPPFTVDAEQEMEHIQLLDTNTLAKYFLGSDAYFNDTGLDEYYARYVYEAPEFYVMLIEHYYMPGVFGIDNDLFDLYTFSKDGKQIDYEQIGCLCYDSNMGANDYYADNSQIYFKSMNEIEVVTVHETGPLFDEGPEGEPVKELSIDTSTTNYFISVKGFIREE